MRDYIEYIASELKSCVTEKDGKVYDIATEEHFDSIENWINRFMIKL